MVAPERDTPGMIASACESPMIRLSSPSDFADFFPVPVIFVNQI